MHSVAYLKPYWGVKEYLKNEPVNDGKDFTKNMTICPTNIRPNK